MHADTSKAQKALNDAEHSLSLTKKEKEDKERDFARLYDPEWFGAQGEWKKLDRTCLAKEVGEYVQLYSFYVARIDGLSPQLHLRGLLVRRGASEAAQGRFDIQPGVRPIR